MDLLDVIQRAPIPLPRRCRIPRDLESVTVYGDEVPGREVGVSMGAVDGLWSALQALYRTGVYPALQVCIRRHGAAVLNRAIGHASGNAPGAPISGGRVPVGIDTPFCLFSASKAVTAMVIHKLDEKGVLHLQDRVCDYIPSFARRGKDRITLHHLLAHRAGIPNLPPDAIDLDLLDEPDHVIDLLAEMPLRTRPGRLLAYHAVSGGFVMAEIVRRATGDDIRTVLSREICEPLGMKWMRYGVAPEDVERVAENAMTGPPVPPGVSGILRNALGMGMDAVVELSNDPRFVTGVIPSANVMANAEELCDFYECLLNDGELDGVRVFDPRTVRHATAEQSYWELDLTLGLPLRYGLGLMLGGEGLSLFGWDNPQAFGHLGFTNILGWADPERALSVALMTSGKPVISLHAVRLIQFMVEFHQAFPKVRRRLPRVGTPAAIPLERARRTPGRRPSKGRASR